MFKNKKILFGIILLILLSFTGCSSNKNTNENKEQNAEATKNVASEDTKEIDANADEDDAAPVDVEETSKEEDTKKAQLNAFDSSEITIEDMNYYSEVYDLVNDFYEKFTLVGDAIDARDDELTDSYLEDLKNIKEKVYNIKATDHFKDSHEYLKSALTEYIDGLDKLKDSYNEVGFEAYMNADSILVSGGDNMNIYAQYVGESLVNFSTLLDSMSEIEYYFKMVVLYEYNKDFKEDENKALFIIERSLCNLSSYTSSLIKNVLNKDSLNSQKDLDEINYMISNIEKIEVSNTNIVTYRDETVKLLKQYIEILNKFTNSVLDNSFKDGILSDINAELESMKYTVYDNLQPFSDFYASYGYDLGFTNSEEQLSQAAEASESNGLSGLSE